MNDFVFTAKRNQSGSIPPITSNPFFPSVDIDRLRAEMRITNTVTDERLMHSTIESVSLVNMQLKDYRLAAQALGKTSIAEMTDDLINEESETVWKYRRAVYCYTKAELLELYPDYDTTAKAGDRAEAKQDQAEDYRRMGHAAIADLHNHNRVDCELI